MAAVLSSRLVKHYSAPCRPSFSSTPSLCANPRPPSRSSSFVCTACLAPQYPTRGHQSAPSTALRSLFHRREQGRSTELQRNDGKPMPTSSISWGFLLGRGRQRRRFYSSFSPVSKEMTWLQWSRAFSEKKPETLFVGVFRTRSTMLSENVYSFGWRAEDRIGVSRKYS